MREVKASWPVQGAAERTAFILPKRRPRLSVYRCAVKPENRRMGADSDRHRLLHSVGLIDKNDQIDGLELFSNTSN